MVYALNMRVLSLSEKKMLIITFGCICVQSTEKSMHQ